MTTQAANSFPGKGKLAGKIIVLAVLIIPLAIYLMQPVPESPAPVAAEAKKIDTPFRLGPGMSSNSKSEAILAESPATADAGAPGGLAVTPGQLLSVNKEMRDVFDYFLVGGTAAERPMRMARLQAHLKAKLPISAYGEAAQIASNYAEYLTALEKLKASEVSVPKTETSSMPMNSADAERFNVMIAQITRLRQSLLGVKVAQLWYGDEEAGMQQSLSDLREYNADPNSAPR